MKKVHVSFLTSGWSMLCANNTDTAIHIHKPPHPERHLERQTWGDMLWVIDHASFLTNDI